MAEQEKNRISVDIYGHTYKMVGTDSIEHMRHVASTVDSKMRELSDLNPILDVNKLAVLTAVNAVDEQIKLKQKIAYLEEQINKLKG